MSPSGSTEQLSDAQIAAIFQMTSRNDSVALIPAGGTGFPQLLPQILVGDYNHDGTVNAADYTVWRNSVGTANLAADGNGDRVIDRADLLVWKNNYGNRGGVGSLHLAPIPEPAAIVLFAAAVTSFALLGRRLPRPPLSGC
jgi:hypothetical protein